MKKLMLSTLISIMMISLTGIVLATSANQYSIDNSYITSSVTDRFQCGNFTIHQVNTALVHLNTYFDHKSNLLKMRSQVDLITQLINPNNGKIAFATLKMEIVLDLKSGTRRWVWRVVDFILPDHSTIQFNAGRLTVDAEGGASLDTEINRFSQFEIEDQRESICRSFA